MQTTSQLYKNIIADPTHTFEVKLNIAGVDYEQGDILDLITDSKVWQQSPTIGGVYSSTCEFSILSDGASIPRMAKVIPYFRARTESQESEWIKKGEFYIDTRETIENGGGIKVFKAHCFDAILKTNAMYAESSISWPAVDVSAINEICTAVGLTQDSRNASILNKGYTVGFPLKQTYRDVLSYIAVMYGANWIITDDGKLRIIPITGNADTIVIGQSVVDLRLSPKRPAYSKVYITVSNEDAFIKGNSDENVMEAYCPSATQTIVNRIYSTLSVWQYQPFEAVGAWTDPSIEVGDKATILSITTPVYSRRISFGSGIVMELSAPNDDYVDHEYSYESPNDRRYKQTVDGLQREIVATATSLSSTIRQVENIQAQVDNAIETFTGAAVPTLNNYPANEWSTDTQKDTHIGDLYVVNSEGGDYEGFYYRFEKVNNSYQWRLLKDSEVTKALAEAEEALRRVGVAETSIEQNAQAITLRATKTEAQQYASTAQTNAINAAASDATSKANQAKTDAVSEANTATDQKLTNYSTTTEMNSAIEVSANAITQTVAATYTTKAEFDDLSIGGKNLLPDSDAPTLTATYKPNGATSAESRYFSGEAISGATYEWISLPGDIPAPPISAENCAHYVYPAAAFKANALAWRDRYVPMVAGQTYTLSGWFYVKSGGIQVQLQYGISPYKRKAYTIMQSRDTWVRHSWSFVADASCINPGDDTIKAWTRVYVGCANIANETGEAYVTGFQLEIGNRATAWNPYTQDLKTRVDKAETTITQNSEQILLRATKEEAQNYASTAENAAITAAAADATTKANNAISTAAADATTKADKAKSDAIQAANAATDQKLVNYSTTTEMNSAINVKADAIEQSVSATYTTKAEFENLNVGAINYLLGTQKMKGWPKDAKATVDDTGEYAIATLNGSSSDWSATLSASPTRDISILDGSSFTFSMLYSVTTNVVIYVTLASTARAPGSTSGARTKYATFRTQTIPSTDGAWKTWSCTVDNITPEFMTAGSGDQNSWYITVYCRTQDAELKIQKLKFEKGNRSTDWSPAPEDLGQEAKDYTDGKLTAYSTTVEMNSAIEQTAESITQTVSETYTTKQEFANLEIGGENLLPDSDAPTLAATYKPNGATDANSRYFSGPKPAAGTYTMEWIPLPDDIPAPPISSKYCAHYIYPATAANRNGVAWYDRYVPMVVGETYTMSAWFYVKTGNVSVHFQYGASPYKSKPIEIISAGDAWVRYSWTFVAETQYINPGDANSKAWTRPYIGCGSVANTASEAYVTGFQMEIGNRATAWGADPDDVETRVTSAEATLSVQAGQIASKVSETDYNGNTIASKINQTATTVKINAAKIDLQGAVTISDFDSAAQAALVKNTTTKNQYAQSASSTTSPTSGWQDTIPAYNATNKYIWLRVATTKTFADNTTSTTYSTPVVDVNLTKSIQDAATAQSTATGAATAASTAQTTANGAVKSSSVKTQYYLSTSASSATGSSWSDTIPTWADGKYLWTRIATTITPVSGTASTTYQPSANGAYDSNLTNALSTATAAASTAAAAQTKANAALVTSVSVYFRASTSTVPGKPTAEVTSTAVNTSDAWTLCMPRPKKDTTYYTCEQNKDGNGTVSWTDVRQMANTTYVASWASSANATYIDGANIYTGSVTADKIAANSIFTQKLTATDFTITGGSIQIDTNNSTYDALILNYQGAQGLLTTKIQPGSVQVSSATTSVHLDADGIRFTENNKTTGWIPATGLMFMDIDLTDQDIPPSSGSEMYRQAICDVLNARSAETPIGSFVLLRIKHKTISSDPKYTGQVEYEVWGAQKGSNADRSYHIDHPPRDNPYTMYLNTGKAATLLEEPTYYNQIFYVHGAWRTDRTLKVYD